MDFKNVQQNAAEVAKLLDLEGFKKLEPNQWVTVSSPFGLISRDPSEVEGFDKIEDLKQRHINLFHHYLPMAKFYIQKYSPDAVLPDYFEGIEPTPELSSLLP